MSYYKLDTAYHIERIRPVTSQLSKSDDFNYQQNQDKLWICIYCGNQFESKFDLKIHFTLHNDEQDLMKFSTKKICSCGKYFSEYHYFENHLLQTGHMMSPNFQSNPDNHCDNSSNSITSSRYSTMFIRGMIGGDPAGTSRHF